MKIVTRITQRVQFTRALYSRPFALLWGGQTISMLGDGAFLTAMAWQVLLLTKSGVAMGIVLIADMAPRVLFLLVGGVLADRLPRRRILLWSDAGRALVVIAIALLGWGHLLQFWHLVLLSLIFGIVGSFFTPAYQAIPPQLVETEALSSANALTGFSQQLGYLLGPPLGAACIAFSGPEGAFAFDGLTFALSSIFLLLISPSAIAAIRPQLEDGLSREEPSPNGKTWRQNLQVLVQDIREGFIYVKTSTWIWVSVVAGAFINVGFAGTIQVALPKLVHDAYGASAWLLGILTAAGAAGSILAILVIGQFHLTRKRGMTAYLAIVVSGIAFAVLGFPLPRAIAPVAASIANAIVEFGIAMFSIVWITVLQELIPGDKLGRVSSIEMMGSYCLLPIGFLIMGAITDHFGPGMAFLIGGILSLLVAVLALCVRSLRQLN